MGIPSFGVGTFRLTGQTVIDSVRNALDVGYRAVDTAQIYGNEAEVGTAIAQSGVPRADLFVTTKIWTENYAKPKLVASLRESLQKLRTDYVDLTLIHWPAPLTTPTCTAAMLAYWSGASSARPVTTIRPSAKEAPVCGCPSVSLRLGTPSPG